MYLARPVQMGQHNLAKSKPRAPPPPPAAPPPPELPQNLKPKSKPAPQMEAVKPVFDRDKLLDEVRCGVQLRHTLTNDKSAPFGVGRVRSGGYSPPPDSVASTSTYNSRPDAKKPVFYGKNTEKPDVPLVPFVPPLPKAAPSAAVLKLGGNATFDRDKLLNEIHGGVKLRKAVTNDRSAPIGVGIVRNDLSRSSSPVPEALVLSNSMTNLSVTPPPPHVPPPPSPDFLSSHVQQHKVAKPITNPALLKLGGKQPTDRDALLASIRSGVKLRKVETNDRSSPFPVSRDTSPDHNIPLAPPPPPLFVPPPPSVSSAEPIRRSRSPNPALMKLGGKITVDRDELMRSIRQGVKLRKTVTNDKSSAIINDDDSGVRSPGRSSPSTSNYEDDVYGSQSLSDISSIGTSRFSSLSNIPPERSVDMYFASPAPVISETDIRMDSTSSSSQSSSSAKSPSNRLPLINITVDVTNYDDDAEVKHESETVRLETPKKRKADECYSSPIPTRKQIEAEIPTGSARNRIKMFDETEREASHSPARNLNRSRKSDMEVDDNGFGVSRIRKLFGDTTVEQSPASAPERHTEEHEQAATVGSGESSIRKMVRKFSADDDSNRASQPVWCQKKVEKAVEEEKNIPLAKQKTSTVKNSVKKKANTKGSKLRRKSSVKNEPPIAMSKKTYAAPTKPEEVSPELPHEVEEAAGEGDVTSKWAVPKVNISKFRERFENPSETYLTSEETIKPGRVKKPPWVKDDESESPLLLPVSRKTEEAPRPSRKKVESSNLSTESVELKNSLEATARKQKSSDREEPAMVVPTSTRTGSAGTTKKVASGFKKDKVSSLSSSSPTKSSEKEIVPVIEEEIAVPTREGVGPYRYTRKISATDKKPAAKKSSTGSRETSTFSGGNLLNSVSKPFGTNFSTTGQTTTIGADDVKGESKVVTANRHLASKNKVQSTDRECDVALGDKTTTAPTAKKTTEKIDGMHYANIGIALTKIYAVPIDNTAWNNQSDNDHSMSTSSFLSNGNCHDSYGSLKQNSRRCLSPATKCKYSDNMIKQQQSPQLQSSTMPRDWNAMFGRAHRVIVGVSESRSKLSKGFQQRSLDDDDNIPIVYQQQQERQQQNHLFHRNYRFQIDLENDQQPVRIVHR
uniref:WH2 domain-containing protein n=1 Tax=Onchocerca volvulus TaxID=6282 RepID=A0A8R1XLL2_ONCVO